MDKTFDLAMYLVAVVCFALAAIDLPSRGRVRPQPSVSVLPRPAFWVALGLLAWVSIPLVLAIRTY